jgi:hypothetical protein
MRALDHEGLERGFALIAVLRSSAAGHAPARQLHRQSITAKFFPGSGAACAPRPMARSVLAFEGEVVGADEVGFGSAPPAGVDGVDCVDLCRSQVRLEDVEGLGDAAWPDGLRDRASDDWCGYAG